MVTRNARSRAISVRLSEEEYVGLKRLCQLTGARSVSDLARDAMHVFLKGVNRKDTLDVRMDELHALLKNVDKKVDELAAGVSAGKVSG